MATIKRTIPAIIVILIFLIRVYAALYIDYHLEYRFAMDQWTVKWGRLVYEIRQATTFLIIISSVVFRFSFQSQLHHAAIQSGSGQTQ